MPRLQEWSRQQEHLDLKQSAPWGKRLHAIEIACGRTIIKMNISTVNPTEFVEALTKRSVLSLLLRISLSE
jgi:hypothetical protein